jgi:3-deoxy-D-manno-octulosonic-acid transferase
MPRSIGVGLYLALSRVTGPLAGRLLGARLAAGKEDPDRIGERHGRATLPRPAGRLVWFHAASVGEALSLIDLIDRLLKRNRGTSVLVTTITRTSAEILARRLPPGAVHQFAPIDTHAAVRRFLDHWKPDVAIWTESEFWPALINQTHLSGAPMLLVNGRISETTFRRARWMGSFAASLLDRFQRLLVQDDTIADQFYRLGADPGRIEVTGNLKDNAAALPHDEVQLKGLRQQVGPRPLWLAASTHPGEETIAVAAHRTARRAFHGLLLILVPRHPERGADLARQLRAEGWRIAQRSAGERLDAETEIYLADTIGEMGLWYRLSPVSFVGGSLVEIGGHNPFEPALLGSAILYGPHVDNFRSAYKRFAKSGAAVRVDRPDRLGAELVKVLAPSRAAALATAAWTVSSEAEDVIARVIDVIEASLNQRLAA